MGVAFGVDPPKQQVFALWSYFDFFQIIDIFGSSH